LIYILSKYRFIYLCQIEEWEVAGTVLADDIWPFVEKERLKGGLRSDWFLTGVFCYSFTYYWAHTQLYLIDYHLLDELLQMRSQAGLPTTNIYVNFDWSIEVSRFWDSIKALAQKSGQSNLPLYTHVVAKFFYHSSVPDDLPCLHHLLNGAKQLEVIKKYISSTKSLGLTKKEVTLAPKKVTLAEAVVVNKEEIRQSSQQDKRTNSEPIVDREFTPKSPPSKRKYVARANSMATSVTSFGKLCLDC
jgi:hypothetical protein